MRTNHWQNRTTRAWEIRINFKIQQKKYLENEDNGDSNQPQLVIFLESVEIGPNEQPDGVDGWNSITNLILSKVMIFIPDRRTKKFGNESLNSSK